MSIAHGSDPCLCPCPSPSPPLSPLPPPFSMQLCPLLTGRAAFSLRVSMHLMPPRDEESMMAGAYRLFCARGQPLADLPSRASSSRQKTKACVIILRVWSVQICGRGCLAPVLMPRQDRQIAIECEVFLRECPKSLAVLLLLVRVRTV